MDLNSTSQKFGLIKQRIVNLKKFTAQLDNTHHLLNQIGNEFELQQQLDNHGLYVKQVPNDPNMLFRAFSDCLTFSQSCFKQIKSSFYKFIGQHANQMAKLLDTFYNDEMELADYMSTIRK